MKIRFAFTITLERGKLPELELGHSDHTGTHHDTGPDTPTNLGFTGPGPKTDQAWD